MHIPHSIHSLFTLTSTQLPQVIKIYENPSRDRKDPCKSCNTHKNCSLRTFTIFSYYLKDVNLLRRDDRIKLGKIWGGVGVEG
jgi:hypothetical protein